MQTQPPQAIAVDSTALPSGRTLNVIFDELKELDFIRFDHNSIVPLYRQFLNANPAIIQETSPHKLSPQSLAITEPKNTGRRNKATLAVTTPAAEPLRILPPDDENLRKMLKGHHGFHPSQTYFSPLVKLSKLLKDRKDTQVDSSITIFHDETADVIKAMYNLLSAGHSERNSADRIKDEYIPEKSLILDFLVEKFGRENFDALYNLVRQAHNRIEVIEEKRAIHREQQTLPFGFNMRA